MRHHLVAIAFSLALGPSAALSAPLEGCLDAIVGGATPTPEVFAMCRYDDAAAAEASREQRMTIARFLADKYIGVKGLPEAGKWVRPLAVSGDPEALYVLSRSYPLGDQHGLTLLALASQEGYLEAQYQLARLYAEGRFVPQDRAKADVLIRDLAAKGYDRAEIAVTFQDQELERDRHADAAAVLAAIGLGILALAANAPVSATEPPAIAAPDGCADAQTIYAWSGGDQQIATAIALFGCSPY